MRRGSNGGNSLSPPSQANVGSMSDVSELEEVHEDDNPNRSKVSARFILGCFLASTLLAYASGRAARVIFIDGPQRRLREEYRRLAIVRDRRIGEGAQNYMPPPLLVAKDGETIPHTRYATKILDTARSISTSSWLMTANEEWQRFDSPNARLPSTQLHKENSAHGDDAESDEEEPQPAAEHLMVDMKNVDRDFLDSEQQLVTAMLQLIEEAQLKLLSYHCHAFTPAGVTCVGLLTRNHISFHTWPVEGVITFDLCTSSKPHILPLLTSIERLFGVHRSRPDDEPMEEPITQWAYKLRGFYNTPTKVSDQFLRTDIGYYLEVFNSGIRNEVVSVETDFQQIDIYDIMNGNAGSDMFAYQRSLSNDGSYESLHPFLYRPNRILFLDGVIQSSLNYEAQYHEALVHPALFAHRNPKRVAIIGGGEGATLREVLKHNTIEEAAMIEIDKVVVSVSKKYIPEWSDCSDLEGSTAWCVDDPRANVFYEDASAWFMDRYLRNERPEKAFDAIIMDALDPESDIPFAAALYSNEEFMRTFYNSLSDDGILVMQLGEAPTRNSPDETHSKFKNRAATTRLLEGLGFEGIHTYEEPNCGFDAPWEFVIGFKSAATRDRWYANAAQVDLEIRKRMLPTLSGANPLRYFDGATMLTYQAPHHVAETVYCRRQPTPRECECLADAECLDISAAAFVDDIIEENEKHIQDTAKFNPVADRHLRHGDSRSPFDIYAARRKLLGDPPIS